MHAALDQTAAVISSYLARRLPQDRASWWADCVLACLTPEQRRLLTERRVRDLRDLDLAALLRVLDANWRLLALPRSAAPYVKEALQIRHRWAHRPAGAVDPDDEYRDIDTLERLLRVLDGPDDAIREMRRRKDALWGRPDNTPMPAVPAAPPANVPSPQDIRSPLRRSISGTTWVAGVDSCRAGWLMILYELSGHRLVHALAARFDELLARPERPVVVAVDMPIGLLDSAVPGGREPDRLLRQLLPGSRKSTVFPAPARPALAASSYPDACEANRRSSSHALGLSRQCYALFPKLAEIDAIMAIEAGCHVVEIHPEFSFMQINGGTPLSSAKATPVGLDERLRLLRDQGMPDLEAVIAAYSRSLVARDDVVDAAAACWSAARIHFGEAVSLPEKPALDAKGLPMRIVG